jgi:hypothetical protein
MQRRPPCEICPLTGEEAVQRILLTIERIADRSSDQVGSVRIEPCGYQEVDSAEVDNPKVDGNLFAAR